MGKYTCMLEDLLSIFGTTAWIAEGIKVVPQNFEDENVYPEYLRVSVVAGGGSLTGYSMSGLLLIDIFTPVGKGPSRTSVIADKLDAYLLGKSFNVGSMGATTQIPKTSNLRTTGAGDSAFCHAIYQVQFNHFRLEV